MAPDATEPIERYTAKRRVVLGVSILKGDTSVAEVARQHGLTVAEVEDWREKFLLGGEIALRSRTKDGIGGCGYYRDSETDSASIERPSIVC